MQQSLSIIYSFFFHLCEIHRFCDKVKMKTHSFWTAKPDAVVIQKRKKYHLLSASYGGNGQRNRRINMSSKQMYRYVFIAKRSFFHQRRSFPRCYLQSMNVWYLIPNEYEWSLFVFFIFFDRNLLLAIVHKTANMMCVCVMMWWCERKNVFEYL